MNHTNNNYDSHEEEPFGGLPGGYLFQAPSFPPFAVILVSIIMAFFLSQVSFAAEATQNSEKQTDDEREIDREKINLIAPLFTPEVQYWESKIVSWSKDRNLDPNLVATVMQIESCGDPKATSSAGAMGLFQVMPFHFESGENPYKPNINARRGLNYLKNSLNASGGETRLAFAGYNGGITGAQRPENSWPSETIRYVYWGTGIYADAVEGKKNSPRLNEWLSAGGASLCRQASKSLGLP